MFFNTSSHYRHIDAHQQSELKSSLLNKKYMSPQFDEPIPHFCKHK
jgi:hypothetical protein